MDDLQVIITAESGVVKENNLAKVKEQLEVLLKDFEQKPIADLKQAKKTRATLNKMFEALENERKRVKGIIDAPYQEFEGIYNDSISRLVECIDFIKAKTAELEPPKEALPKKTIAFICDCDVDEQTKIEKFLQKYSIEYKLKIKE